MKFSIEKNSVILNPRQSKLLHCIERLQLSGLKRNASLLLYFIQRSSRNQTIIFCNGYPSAVASSKRTMMTTSFLYPAGAITLFFYWRIPSGRISGNGGFGYLRRERERELIPDPLQAAGRLHAQSFSDVFAPRIRGFLVDHPHLELERSRPLVELDMKIIENAHNCRIHARH